MKSLLIPILSAFSLLSQVKQVDPPAGNDSGMPFFAKAPDGSLYASWIDNLAEQGHAFRYARWNDTAWGKPETIAQGKGWFVNWADFPSLAVLPDGSMMAHWLTRNATGGKYGYGIRIAKKSANTNQWREVHSMSLDQKEDYAGFLTFLPNAAAAVYLGPTGEGEHRKTVRFVSFSPDGSVSKDRQLDGDVCSCCQTAIGATSKGLIAAYRDHLPGEIRDIAITRQIDGVWSQPKTLNPDGWKINGCPTDGPSIASRNNEVGITWLTRAQEKPRIQIAISRDAGATFPKLLRVDDGNPLGRPSLTALDDDTYLALWLEKSGDDKVEIRLRKISVDGSISASLLIATAPLGRAAGFPKLAVVGRQVLVAWRDGHVRTVLLNQTQMP